MRLPAFRYAATSSIVRISSGWSLIWSPVGRSINALGTGTSWNIRARLCKLGQTWHERAVLLPPRVQAVARLREVNQPIAGATVASNYEAICEENRESYGTKGAQKSGKLAAGLYDDRTHFIFELLQNAEDALGRRGEWHGSRKVTFTLNSDPPDALAFRQAVRRGRRPKRLRHRREHQERVLHWSLRPRLQVRLHRHRTSGDSLWRRGLRHRELRLPKADGTFGARGQTRRRSSCP